MVERLPVASEVRINLEALSHIAHDDEGRGLVSAWQEPDIVLGLTPGVQHKDVPLPLRSLAATRRSFRDEQVCLPVDLFVTALLPGLLGFEDKAIPLIKIEPSRCDRAVTARLLNHALENVVIFVVSGRRRVRVGQVQKVA